jgi:hypothetical protein
MTLKTPIGYFFPFACCSRNRAPQTRRTPKIAKAKMAAEIVHLRLQRKCGANIVAAPQRTNRIFSETVIGETLCDAADDTAFICTTVFMLLPVGISDWRSNSVAEGWKEPGPGFDGVEALSWIGRQVVGISKPARDCSFESWKKSTWLLLRPWNSSKKSKII